VRECPVFGNLIDSGRRRVAAKLIDGKAISRALKADVR